MADDFKPNISQRILLKAKSKVVHDWRRRLKDFSTIALALSTALLAAWQVYPDDLKAGLPPNFVHWLNYAMGGILIWGLVGKFIVQGDAPASEPPQ